MATTAHIRPAATDKCDTIHQIDEHYVAFARRRALNPSEQKKKKGLRPDACADDGRTALHLAAGEGASKVAAKLVELGADVKRADRQGRNALDIARAAGYYDLEARLRLLAET